MITIKETERHLSLSFRGAMGLDAYQCGRRSVKKGSRIRRGGEGEEIIHGLGRFSVC